MLCVVYGMPCWTFEHLHPSSILTTRECDRCVYLLDVEDASRIYFDMLDAHLDFIMHSASVCHRSIFLGQPQRSTQSKIVLTASALPQGADVPPAGRRNVSD